jgi:hypothetical protein
VLDRLASVQRKLAAHGAYWDKVGDAAAPRRTAASSSGTPSRRARSTGKP